MSCIDKFALLLPDMLIGWECPGFDQALRGKADRFLIVPEGAKPGTVRNG
jgi:hypothetical protein